MSARRRRLQRLGWLRFASIGGFALVPLAPGPALAQRDASTNATAPRPEFVISYSVVGSAEDYTESIGFDRQCTRGLRAENPYGLR